MEQLSINQIKELLQLAKEHALASQVGKDTTKKAFAAYPSYLPARYTEPQKANTIIIDIGGTSTKVCASSTNPTGRRTWHVLFEVKNKNMSKEEPDKFPSFCKQIAQLISQQLSEINFNPETIEGCAIVWSNPMRSLKKNQTTISATVGNKKLYNKREWFIEDLKEGDDIGAPFLEALKLVSITPTSFLIANDTTLTMKAAHGADAGVVCSTGLNATIVKKIEGQFIVCNSECGHTFTIPTSYLCKHDYEYSNNGIRVEALTAGGSLPRQLISHIHYHAENNPSLKQLSAHLQSLGEEQWTELRGPDLTYMIKNRKLFRERRTQPEIYTESILDIIETIAEPLIERAGILCAIILFGSVSNRDKANLKIALDSRLAREQPVFWNALNRTIKQINSELQHVITVELLEPIYLSNGSISVPMLGAVNALDSIISATRQRAA